MRNVLLNWPADVLYGWGVVGLNLFMQWADDPELRALMGMEITPRNLAAVDPLRVWRLRPAINASNGFQARLREAVAQGRKLDFPVVEGLGNGLAAPSRLTGSLTLGRCVFEDTNLTSLNEKLGQYDRLVTASAWNAALLRAHCGKPVSLIHEGIDPALFHPAPKSGLFDANRFYIFSGGKVEFRKGHDLTILAFREFSRRHDDAVLVTAWHSPFPQFSVGFQGRLSHPLAPSPQGVLDFRGWLAANGVDPSKVIELGTIPNPVMPQMLREMDCALAPSRAEACTNLLAKEAMGCGIPAIVAANTGVLDIVDSGNCVPLMRQQPVRQAGIGTDGWGESDVDEIVEALEKLYSDTALRQAIGARGSEWLSANGRTWADHAQAMKILLLA